MEVGSVISCLIAPGFESCRHGVCVTRLSSPLGRRARRNVCSNLTVHPSSSSSSSSSSSQQQEARAALRWPIAAFLSLALMLHPGFNQEAHAFGWFGGGSAIDKDPVEPFTLYGSVFKKYFIEKIVDGKVVSRKKGFTTTACVNALDADKETPEPQGVPPGLKVIIIGEPVCRKSEGQTREETCLPSCKSACNRAIGRHLTEVTKETGYVLDSKDADKVLDLCSNQCTNECLKPGKTAYFISPFRPSK